MDKTYPNSSICIVVQQAVQGVVAHECAWRCDDILPCAILEVARVVDEVVWRV